MAYDQIFDAGATSKLIEVPIRSSTTGQLLTGLLYSDMTIDYFREGAAAKVSGVGQLVTMTAGTWVSWGFIETDRVGVYQFGIPNASLLTGAKAVTFTFAASGSLDKSLRIVLGPPVLISVGTGAGQINVASGKVPATVAAGDVSGNLPADVQTVKTRTVTDVGLDNTVYVGTAAWSTVTTAQINTEVDTALADYDGPTNAEMLAAIAAISVGGVVNLSTETTVIEAS